ncbi:MAG: NAD(+) synthase, partial [Lachnospiraceae bacterium]|nr:NAD(+) synthase [Lachnospiraceae bacterium]
MVDDFVRVGAFVPEVSLADVSSNVKNIIKIISQEAKGGVKVMAFPELCITGYSCGELFLQDLLLEKAKKGLLEIAKACSKTDAF